MKNRKNVHNFATHYLKQPNAYDNLGCRSFKNLSAPMLIAYAKIFRARYRLPSIVMGIKKTPSGFRVQFQGGKSALKNEVLIPDYDLKEILETDSETKWMFCLISNDQFIELGVDVEPNPVLLHILGIKNAHLEDK